MTKKNQNIIWIVVISVSILLLLLLKPETFSVARQKYSLTEFQCYIGQTEYYTCPDGSKFLNCFCDNGEWLCIPDPAKHCEDTGHIAPEEEPPENGITPTKFPTYYWWILGGIIIFIFIMIRRRR